MNTRTYVAQTMAEALREVKRDLGPYSVILRTRYVRRRDLLGLLGRRVWEVTAAPDEAPARPEGQYIPAPAQPVATQTAAPAPAARCDDGETHVESIGEVRQMLQALMGRLPGGPAPEGGALPTIHARLLDQDVDPQIASDLVGQLRLDMTGRQLQDAPLVWRKAHRLLAERIPAAGPLGRAEAGRPYVVALVGPTGVGKTTTIAKLAAGAKLREGRRVGLITMDTYRIAAVEQLRTYAEIIELPIRTALTPDELGVAIQEMSDRDLVLLDTAGRSQNNQVRLSELGRFLQVARPAETHLVLAATASRLTAKGIVESFRATAPNRLILSKLDEAGSLGLAVNAAAWSGLGLSYVATGQEVPDDLAMADADELARDILGEPVLEPGEGA